ncbi:alpha-amylase family glycosyl hydrolase [Pedobacter sandarakinus]|uniref:alpha-amylase family glycosyl hydrolase n=1 Tax=Pedobacter sandarakinus TaxID=353156 RepID=UPI0022474890|nr:alpha-amylase family glycosyl hydrolase [Pedobacter sandarakinus]MCX2574136.1 alpha-amylase family glycosyl hydrolase [Pedobacter sandarakinus]
MTNNFSRAFTAPFLFFILPILSFAQGLSYPAQYGKPFQGVPDPRDVILYQINTRAFSKSGDFAGVTARLDSIKSLGVNVIYLMPIYPVGKLKGANSPYATQDYDAVGKEFGTLADLRALVDGAHNRNIAVMLDIVANHTSWDHPWINKPGYYLRDSLGQIKYPETWKDVAQLDFRNQELRLSLIHSMKSWVYKANIDGFRCDYADGPPLDFWKQVNDSLKAIKTHKLLMLAEGGSPKYLGVGFDYFFGFNYFGNLKNIFNNKKSVKSLDSLNVIDFKGAKEGQAVVRYLTNHDVNGSDGTPLELFGGKSGSMAAFVITAYMKGIPMIYNGQEIGTPFRLTFPFTGKSIDWSLAKANEDILQDYKKIVAFWNKSTTVRRGKLISYNSDDVCIFTKSLNGKRVLVIANLRDRKVVCRLPKSLSGQWINAFSRTETKLPIDLELKPFQYLVVEK